MDREEMMAWQLQGRVSAMGKVASGGKGRVLPQGEVDRANGRWGARTGAICLSRPLKAMSGY